MVRISTESLKFLMNYWIRGIRAPFFVVFDNNYTFRSCVLDEGRAKRGRRTKKTAPRAVGDSITHA